MTNTKETLLIALLDNFYTVEDIENSIEYANEYATKHPKFADFSYDFSDALAETIADRIGETFNWNSKKVDIFRSYLVDCIDVDYTIEYKKIYLL